MTLVGLKGHARPTHYTVVHDENKFNAVSVFRWKLSGSDFVETYFLQDELQRLCHELSHTFARATRGVSLIPPAYCACNCPCVPIHPFTVQVLQTPILHANAVAVIFTVCSMLTRYLPLAVVWPLLMKKRPYSRELRGFGAMDPMLKSNRRCTTFKPTLELTLSWVSRNDKGISECNSGM